MKMGNDRIRVDEALTPEERLRIARASAGWRGAGSLSAIALFLRESFSLELVLDPDVIAGFTTDSSNLPGRAAGLCRPRSAREAAVCFRACFRAGIPFTISAGRSNLTGSATPEGGVVISTRELLSPAAAVNRGAMTVVAPAGMILEDMRREVLAQTAGEMAYAVDPTSRADATVGGAAACNASGFTPGEMGATRPWVRAVEFLLPDGGLIRAARGQYASAGGRFRLERADAAATDLPVPAYRRPAIKNAGGPYSAPDGVMDFVDLVVGSEGIFGMVASCELALTRRPADCFDVFFSLPGEREALRLHRVVSDRLGGNLGALTAFEYFGVHCRKYMDHEESLFCGDHQVGVNIQAPLPETDPDAAIQDWVETLRNAGCGIDENAILVLDNDRSRKLFIEARHSMPARAVEIVQRRGTYTIMTDTVVPPDRFAEFLEHTHGIIARHGIEYLCFGHFGDCHLHFTLLPELSQLEAAAAVYDEIVDRSAQLGGVYSGEHGTGKRKRRDFLRCYGLAAAAEIRRCKAALDPAFLLNRGNVVESPPAPGEGAGA
jgi:D-lactate dehydrogenase (cytochrome)